ncbi:RDD family protein [Chitinibacter bivalviorum]|uniref:RDD family protein n=1 Tax=Chitinibacter bivalviorum TaxID=2739434 RepID=A0A7H9BHA2_9NEIS|nr:RDD family protein [Chitinibacter bivalviorum]QLG88007.1 RDD family protein [Chitinibacter bivalviorum]
MEKGTIIHYNQNEGKGIINAAGEAHQFMISHWKGTLAPVLNETVLIEMSEAGVVGVHPVRGLINETAATNPIAQFFASLDPSETAVLNEQPIVIAPISRRLLGGLIDFLIFLAFDLVVGIGTLGVGALLGPIIVCAAMAIMMATPSIRGTLGMKLVGLEICSVDGKIISVGTSFLRLVISFLSCILLIGYIVACFSKKNQTFHDLVAGTIVIQRRGA